MITQSIMAAILDSLKGPVLFADTDHITRYYTDGKDQIGRSLLECHNERSQAMMVEILAAMHQGLEERLITEEEEYRVYMRAVRDPSGRLLGYYERYEPPPEPEA